MSGVLTGLFSCAIFLVVIGTLFVQNEFSLTGTVADTLDTPMAGVNILLISQERARQTKSEANGSFAFYQIPAGLYEVEVTAPGFAKQKISINLQDRMTQPSLSIALRVGNQPDMELCGSHASVTYGPLGKASSQLSGTVQDYVHRHTLRNAKVTLWKVDSSQAVFQARSNASGRFQFESLPVGSYNLRIAEPGYQSLDIKQLVKPEKNEVVIDATILQQNKMIACQ